MLRLYGAMASPYVARVVLYARLKGLELPVEPPPGGGIKSPEYLHLSPIGKMPAMEVDGQGLAESAILCEFLEELHPDPPGLPADPWLRARSRLVARITDLYLAPAVSRLVRQLDPARRDPAVVSASCTEIGQVFGHLAWAMADGPWCAGAMPSLGDCALATSVRSLALFRPAFPGLPDPCTSGRLAEWSAAVADNREFSLVLGEYAEALGRMMGHRNG